MKRITIDKVTNGYLVNITNEGNQTLYDKAESFIAADIDELIKIIKDNA